MNPTIKEFLKQLTGHYSDRIIDCKSYNIIQFLQQTNYKPTQSYLRKRRKQNV
jgi:hypothetical protein